MRTNTSSLTQQNQKIDMHNDSITSNDSHYCSCCDGSSLFFCCYCCCRSKRNHIKGKNIWSKLFRINDDESTDQQFQHIFQVLIDLYNGQDAIHKLLECRANPDFDPNHPIRNDLEYYIPQLTNFMIFHDEAIHDELRKFMLEISKKDFYFGHRYYWYLNSLLVGNNPHEKHPILQELEDECSENQEGNIFMNSYANFILKQDKKKVDEVVSLNDLNSQERKDHVEKMIKGYKADDLNTPAIMNFLIKASDIQLKNYVKIFQNSDDNYGFIQDKEAYSNGFTSTLHFFEDLRKICEKISNYTDKLTILKQYLNEMNKNLPACVYVPFIRNYLRNSAVLHIAVEHTKIFSSKDRTPCYVCLELYRPEEELENEYQESLEKSKQLQAKKSFFGGVFKKKESSLSFGKISNNTTSMGNMSSSTKIEKKMNEIISKPITLKNLQDDPSSLLAAYAQKLTIKRSVTSGPNLEHTPPSKTKIATDGLEEEKEQKSKMMSPIRKANTSFVGGSDKRREVIDTIMFNDEQSKMTNQPGIDFGQSSPSHGKLTLANGLSMKLFKIESIEEPLMDENMMIDSKDNFDYRLDDEFFGEDSSKQTKRIMESSPFGKLKSWRLSHMIIKVGADLKEEQFAIQLISQFDQLFKKEKSKLLLTPYEIISLGPNFGLVEMIKDAATISSIKEKYYKKGLTTLNEFFSFYFGKSRLKKAKKNFARSLAAYSLICYFLQIKDRHNGNIMLKKDGSIIHIDFGYFLTNSPGRGLEIERTVPFKLLNEYVEVLEDARSSLFQDFRKYFANGFKIAHKYKDEILILVKMMYSSQGQVLPCFKGGNRALKELEERFCPPGVNLNTDHEIYVYCQKLINNSLDNWKAKCYDKYQYYFQGIFY